MTRDLDDLRDEYLRQQLAGDRRAALRFIDSALLAGTAVADIRCHVVQAAQREIGRLWQENRITIAQEHMATAISQLALAHLFQHAEFQARLKKKVLVACVPGEQHEFPARLLADALELAGYDVRFLGADVPVESLLRAIEQEQPDVVALSVTMLFHVPALRATVREVRTRTVRPVQIAIGGNVLSTSPELVADVGADMVAADAEDFVALVSGRLGVMP